MYHCSSAIFTQQTSVQREKYRGLGHVVDRSIRSVDRRFSCPPLLHHYHSRVFEFRGYDMTVPSRKNMVPSFEDTLPLGTCIPGVSPCGREGTTASRLGVRL